MDTWLTHDEAELFESLRGGTTSRTVRYPIEPGAVPRSHGSVGELSPTGC
jgi:hypothetical protein